MQTRYFLLLALCIFTAAATPAISPLDNAAEAVQDMGDNIASGMEQMGDHVKEGTNSLASALRAIASAINASDASLHDEPTTIS